MNAVQTDQIKQVELTSKKIANEARRLYEENQYYRILTDRIGYKKSDLEEIAFHEPYALPVVHSGVFKRSDMVDQLYSGQDRTGQDRTGQD